MPRPEKATFSLRSRVQVYAEKRYLLRNSSTYVPLRTTIWTFKRHQRMEARLEMHFKKVSSRSLGNCQLFPNFQMRYVHWKFKFFATFIFIQRPSWKPSWSTKLNKEDRQKKRIKGHILEWKFFFWLDGAMTLKGLLRFKNIFISALKLRKKRKLLQRLFSFQYVWPFLNDGLAFSMIDFIPAWGSLTHSTTIL